LPFILTRAEHGKDSIGLDWDPLRPRWFISRGREWLLRSKGSKDVQPHPTAFVNSASGCCVLVVCCVPDPEAVWQYDFMWLWNFVIPIRMYIWLGFIGGARLPSILTASTLAYSIHSLVLDTGEITGRFFGSLGGVDWTSSVFRGLWGHWVESRDRDRRIKWRWFAASAGWHSGTGVLQAFEESANDNNKHTTTERTFSLRRECTCDVSRLLPLLCPSRVPRFDRLRPTGVGVGLDSWSYGACTTKDHIG
jgi:hypothetical protein